MGALLQSEPPHDGHGSTLLEEYALSDILQRTAHGNVGINHHARYREPSMTTSRRNSG